MANRTRDEPLARALILLGLAAVTAGILQGYVARGNRTVSRHGMEDFGLFHASGRQFLGGGRLYGPLRRPGTTRLSDARNLNPPHTSLLFLPFALLPPASGLQAWILLSLVALLDIVRVTATELRLPLLSLRTAGAAVFLLAWAPTAALVITGQFGDVTWYGHYMNASVWGLLERVLQGFRPYAPLVPAPRTATFLAWAIAGGVLGLTWWRTAAERENVDVSFTLLTAAALLASPLGWVYYFWLPVAPATATIVAAVPSWSRAERAVACVVGVCLLWHASATVWFQPSGVATLTVASPYFWALFGVWFWLLMRPDTMVLRSRAGVSRMPS